MDIESQEKLVNATISSGGTLTNELQEKELAVSQRKIPDFVKKHPDSPVSLTALMTSIKFYKLDIARAESRFGYPKELFALLSERLKLSKQGLLLKQEIAEVYNLK